MRQWSLTRHLKKYDSKLYCAPINGVLCVWRKSYCFDCFDFDEQTYHYSKLAPFYIFALTDNWKPNGKPVEWGIEVVMDRIRRIDDWNRDTYKEMIDYNEKQDEAKERGRKSMHEDVAREMKPAFAKAFDEFNLSTVTKTSRRREYEKRKGKLTL